MGVFDDIKAITAQLSWSYLAWTELGKTWQNLADISKFENLFQFQEKNDLEISFLVNKLLSKKNWGFPKYEKKLMKSKILNMS